VHIPMIASNRNAGASIPPSANIKGAPKGDSGSSLGCTMRSVAGERLALKQTSHASVMALRGNQETMRQQLRRTRHI
jgi:hypothetical protein